MSFTPEAEAKAKKMEADPELAKLGTCMVKTHLSLSHDPNLKGTPKGWVLPIRDVLTYEGRSCACQPALFHLCLALAPTLHLEGLT